MNVLRSIAFLGLLIVSTYSLILAGRCQCTISESHQKKRHTQQISLFESQSRTTSFIKENIPHHKACKALCEKSKAGFGFSPRAQIEVQFTP
jgi:uncharacterized protein (DUF305 family)